MAQSTKIQNKDRSGERQKDPRFVELVKLLARQAAERDYKELQENSISDDRTLRSGEMDS